MMGMAFLIRSCVKIKILLLLVMVSCVREEHHLIMSSPVVSLTKSHPPQTPLSADRYVQIRWCQGDKEYLEKDRRKQVLIDQVLAKAHAETGSPYFMNANFYQEAVSSRDWTFSGWNSCVTMRGHTVK